MEKFQLNDLPRYNNWMAELLGGRAKKREKNEQQIIREFGREKWGFLLSKWKERPCGCDEVRGWQNASDSHFAGLIEEKLMLMRSAEAHDFYVSLIELALINNSSDHLVEIGIGFGSILFELLKRGKLPYDSIVGLEYTKQGVELANEIANWHNYNVSIAQGDFNRPGISKLKIKHGADILTSYSFHYLKDSELALKNIINLKPRRVVHFEPIFEHYKSDTTLGLLQQKYMEVNDYNMTILKELKKLSKENKIEILKEVPLLFGSNCLLPASLIVWQPAK